MQSSPVLPGSTSLLFSLTIYSWVFAMGWPMVMTSSDFETFFIADQMVVSVGPYMFQSSRTLSIMFFANTIGNASPVDIALIGKGVSQPE